MNRRRIIGLCGYDGHGKDTVASFVPALRLAFADPLYEEVAAAFGVSVEWLQRREYKETPSVLLDVTRCRDAGFRILLREGDPQSPRTILRLWGTEYRRRTDSGYWLRRIERRALPTRDDLVISDVRFDDEANWVRDMGGELWLVHDPRKPIPQGGHASTQDPARFHPDRTITNDGTLDALRIRTEAAWLTI